MFEHNLTLSGGERKTSDTRIFSHNILKNLHLEDNPNYYLDISYQVLIEQKAAEYNWSNIAKKNLKKIMHVFAVNQFIKNQRTDLLHKKNMFNWNEHEANNLLINQIARVIGLKRRQTQRYMAILIKTGILTKTQNGKNLMSRTELSMFGKQRKLKEYKKSGKEKHGKFYICNSYVVNIDERVKRRCITLYKATRYATKSGKNLKNDTLYEIVNYFIVRNNLKQSGIEDLVRQALKKSYKPAANIEEFNENFDKRVAAEPKKTVKLLFKTKHIQEKYKLTNEQIVQLLEKYTPKKKKIRQIDAFFNWIYSERVVLKNFYPEKYKQYIAAEWKEEDTADKSANESNKEDTVDELTPEDLLKQLKLESAALKEPYRAKVKELKEEYGLGMEQIGDLENETCEHYTREAYGRSFTLRLKAIDCPQCLRDWLIVRRDIDEFMVSVRFRFPSFAVLGFG